MGSPSHIFTSSNLSLSAKSLVNPAIRDLLPQFTFLSFFHLLQTGTWGSIAFCVVLFFLSCRFFVLSRVLSCSHSRVLCLFDCTWEWTCLCCISPGTESSINLQTSPTSQNEDCKGVYYSVLWIPTGCRDVWLLQSQNLWGFSLFLLEGQK